jgi:hypothetical protein
MLKFKIIGLALALVVIAGLVAVASGATGAYFSDTRSGNISGTIGDIAVTTSGGIVGNADDGINFQWNNMVPGVQYSATVTYQNTGHSVQDVWLVFNNKTALSRFNSIGAFGAARVTSSDGAYFYSNNLNDHKVDQGGTTPPRGTVKMLPATIKLASNVGPTASGTMTFTFAYASGMVHPEAGNVFNKYPLETPGSAAGAGWPDDGNQASYDQNYANPAVDGSGSGLPFEIVATQPGIEPGDQGAYAGF